MLYTITAAESFDGLLVLVVLLYFCWRARLHSWIPVFVADPSAAGRSFTLLRDATLQTPCMAISIACVGGSWSLSSCTAWIPRPDHL